MLLLFPEVDLVVDSLPAEVGKKINNSVKEVDKVIRTFLTSSAVLATVSKPMYAKKTVADPASTPLTPYGKYLKKIAV